MYRIKQLELTLLSAAVSGIRGSRRPRFYNKKISFRFLTFALMGVLIVLGVFGFDYISRRGNEDFIYLRIPRCKNLSHSHMNDLTTRKTWTRVTDSVFVYSAFYDQDKGNKNDFIRIVGIWKVPPREELIRDPIRWYRIKEETFMNDYSCSIFYEMNGEFIRANGTSFTREIFEEGLKMYAGNFYKCYIPKELQNIMDNQHQQRNEIEFKVAVYPNNVENYPTKLMDVNLTPGLFRNSEKRQGSEVITICVRPLFGPMNNLAQLAQFISYYEGIGVQKFVFYILSISPTIRLYFKTLWAKGLNLQLNEWNLPTGNSSELWDYGSLAALNDCIYSNMNGEIVLVVDIDEFIVPQQRYQFLSEILSSNETLGNGNDKIELIVRNAFFCQEFCEPSDISAMFPIFTCTVRTKRIWSAKLRSKYIIKYPRQVVQIGHHYTTKFMSQSPTKLRTSDFTKTLSTRTAILNHYRACGPISTRKSPILNRVTVNDSTILKFRSQVMKSTAYKVYREFGRRD